MSRVLIYLIIVCILYGCVVLQGNPADQLIADTSINKNFICETDTSVCYEGLELGTRKMLIVFKNSELNKTTRTLATDIHIKDGAESISGAVILAGSYKNAKIYSKKRLSISNKNGEAKFKVKVSENDTEVIYVICTGYQPVCFDVQKLFR